MANIKQRPAVTWEQVPVIMDSAYLAMLLGIPKEDVRLMARRGELPGIKVGKRVWRFEKTSVMKALNVVQE